MQKLFRFIDDMATADVAFQAWGSSYEKMCVSAVEAVLHVLVNEPQAVQLNEEREVELEDDDQDMLLFQLLQEVIYWKDTDKLLLRVKSCRLKERAEGWTLSAVLAGERIDPSRHQINVDVKAVTMHEYCVTEEKKGWEATVVLDV